MKVNIGIDLGGTNTKFGIVSAEHKILEEKSIPTNATSGPEASLKEWATLIEGWKKKYQVGLIGIGSPGPLDTDQGIILTTPNLPGWAKFPITATLKKLTGISSYIENDANCSALGEFASTLTQDLVMVTLGTGVGTGVISSGKLVRGVHGYGVEAGHMVVDLNGPVCGCGRKGCLEALVGGRRLVERYNEKSKDKIKDLDARSVFERASKDSWAHQLVEDWISGLAVGVGNLINIFNPSQVVVTGGLSAAFQKIKPRFMEILLRQAFEPSLKCCEVVVSQQQERAALIGAALWAKQQDERHGQMS